MSILSVIVPMLLLSTLKIVVSNREYDNNDMPAPTEHRPEHRPEHRTGHTPGHTPGQAATLSGLKFLENLEALAAKLKSLGGKPSSRDAPTDQWKDQKRYSFSRVLLLPCVGLGQPCIPGRPGCSGDCWAGRTVKTCMNTVRSGFRCVQRRIA